MPKKAVDLVTLHMLRKRKLQKPTLELSTDISFLFKDEKKKYFQYWTFPDTNPSDLPFRERKIQMGKAANLSRVTFWKLLMCFKHLWSSEYSINPNARHLWRNYRWDSQKILRAISISQLLIGEQLSLSWQFSPRLGLPFYTKAAIKSLSYDAVGISRHHGFKCFQCQLMKLHKLK